MAQSSSAVVRYRTAGALDGRPGLALLCAVAALGMIAATDLKAQTSGDFIDPLENLRQTLQPAEPAQPDAPATSERAPLAGTVPAQPAPDLSQSPVPTRRGAEFADDPLFQAATQAREAMSGSAGQAEAAASTIWQRIRTASAGLSERIGMPVEWLLGGFGGTLALLSLFLGWRLFRIPTASVRGRTSDVYSRVGRSERRRVADRDEARPARGKAKPEAVTDEAEEERLPLDGKRPLPLTEPDFAMNSDLADAPTITVPNRDPSTWKRPNLDRLRESIRSDWESAREEAEGGNPATATTSAPEPAPVDEPANDAGDEALDALLTPEAPSHPADLPLREVASNWDDWDKSLDADGDVFGADQPAEPAEPAPARPSGDEALRRIRALREALKAS